MGPIHIDVIGAGNIIGGEMQGEGNVFIGMAQNAILLIGDNNLVIGNYIGIFRDNLTTLPNKFGVFVIGSNNTIGGTRPGDGNVISGNRIAGISIAAGIIGAGVGNKVIGNYIGTDLYGAYKMPNQHGIEILEGSDITIGGSSPAHRNLISGNSASGIVVGIKAHDVTIRGNYIGTDASGTTNLGNRDGVTLGPGSNHCTVEENLIMGNTSLGVLISGVAGGAGGTPLASTHHRVSGNKIVHNQGHGVLLVGNATDNVIGSSLTQNYDSNQVQYNGTSGTLLGGGVYILGNDQGAPKENTIRKNAFLGNAPFGIFFDIDNIVQDDIKPPTILTYEDSGAGNVAVTGRHDRPGSLIDVYTGEKNAAFTFQGRRWLGADYVGLDSSFSVPITNACNCDYLVATATDIFGNTSEFSYPAFQVRNTTITAQFSLNSGWNMLSVPFIVADYNKTVLYPTAASPAYDYSGGYTAQPIVQNGKGYWLKYPASTALSYTGMIIPQETVTVSKGWNMVGTPSTPVLRSTVVPVGTTIQPNMYGYTSGVGYYIEDTLKPGLGYWAKASASGQLILTGSLNVPKVPTRPDPLAGLSCISITDAVGNKQNLYLGTDSPKEPGDFELPPVPLGGIFDARFASQRIAEFLGDEESKELPILVSAAEYPLSLSIELHGLRASVVVNKKEIRMPNSRKVEIPGGASRILLRIVKGEESPTRFTLEQNYPNPFNPVTSIEYRVASREYVSLKVYDVLGREVATLVNEIRQPGTYTVTWDARQTDGGRAVSLPSGVYYYRLTAQGFTDVKKVILLK